METTSALCISRSTIETTQAALGKISRHSAKERFNAGNIVMRTPGFQRPAIPCLGSYGSPHKGRAARQRGDQFVAGPETPGAQRWCCDGIEGFQLYRRIGSRVNLSGLHVGMT